MRNSVPTNTVFNAALALVLFVTCPASAHHSQAAFDRDSIVTLVGEVSRYEWRNPHVYIFLEFGEDDSVPVEWQIEADPTPLMSRNGWRPDTLAPGDAVVVRAHPDNSHGRNRGLLISLTTPDAVILTPRANGSVSPASATGISGVWDALRGFTIVHFNFGGVTERAIAAQSAYEESQNPVRDCRAYATPGLIALPYLHEIEIQDDRILMRTEFFRVERTIYMDGRGHAANGARTNQGHSIGWWEGDVPVVDTALFAPHSAGMGPGRPSGADKHVVERFALDEDGTRLIIDFIVEDAEYLVDPMTGTMEWDYAPDAELSSFDCDPENARQFAIE